MTAVDVEAACCTDDTEIVVVPQLDVKKQDVYREPHKALEFEDIKLPTILLCILVGLCAFFVFIVGLTLMGSSFKAMTGSGASALFGAVKDPIAGLMVGVLATVMVQSSSTSTSIVVAMVSADAINVQNAIPIVMGANIGTSVTNTIVSMGQSGNRIDLERSFAGATVHDMFNFLTVAVLLPIEVICSVIDGEGGPLYWMTYSMTNCMMGGEGGQNLPKSPLKTITAPVAEIFVKANKYIIYAQTLDKPEAIKSTSVCSGVCTPIDGVNSTSCGRRLESEAGEVFTRSLLSKRQLAEAAEPLKDVDCGEYSCVSGPLASNFKKVNKKAYVKLVSCKAALPSGAYSCPDSYECYLGADKYYEAEVIQGRLISKGVLKGAGDEAGGVIGVLIALVFMTIGLIALCKSLQKVFIGKAKVLIKYSTRLNDYVAILLGAGITLVVQSSSVTTSALTPLCGMGVLPLRKMLPMTLGANIGTTCTALIAACVDLKFRGVQIALAHLLFNIIGILIWFPAPILRALPLKGAALLGRYASYYRFVPALYIVVVFLVLPAVFLAISQLFYVSLAGGIVALVVFLAAIAVLEFWWWKGFSGKSGALMILSEEQRYQGHKELVAANSRMMGITEEQWEREANTLSWWGK